MNNRILPLLCGAACISPALQNVNAYEFRNHSETDWTQYRISYDAPLRAGCAEFHPQISQRQRRKAARRSGRFPVRK